MKRNNIFYLGALILIGLLIVALGGFGDESDERAEKDRDRTSAVGYGKSDRRSDVSSWSPDAAADKLRALKEGKGGTGWSFDEVSTMVRKLSDEELQKLVEEVGLGRTEGMLGWVRAALFAEWGERDLEGAMSFLGANAESDSAAQQALYAVFRGSRPSDPQSALLHIEKMFAGYSSATGAYTRQWAEQALQDVFREWARADHAQAWDLLWGDGEGEHARAMQALAFLSKKFGRIGMPGGDSEWVAFEGFFDGLRDIETVRSYASEFHEQWNSRETQIALLNYRATRHLQSSFSGMSEPPEEGAARVIGRSLARFDLQAAAQWMATQGPGDGRTGNGRLGHMWTEWAKARPDAALQVMRSGEFESWNQTLATSAMRGDARLAAAIAEEFGEEVWISDALMGSFPVAATMDEADLFPVPGAGNHVPDHLESYEVFLGAIEVSRLDERQRRNVLRSLNGSFRYTVEEAAEAYDLAQGNN